MNNINVVALAGGVGGAKLATGLQAALPPGQLTVIVNTGDDFEHWGLTICPDLDTVMYNLAGVHNPEMGWGRVNDTFATLDTMGQLGGEDWFRLGDKDLAIHLRRTQWLQQGLSLTEVTDRLRRCLGVPSVILPMSDQPVRTLVHTDEGDLPFQHYFVRRRSEPIVVDLTYVGAAEAHLTPEVEETIATADLIVFCPSNPYLSIDPILSIPGLRRLLRTCPAPRVAVSPIVGGQAIKGPAAKMMHELGAPTNPVTVLRHFDSILTGFVLDRTDEDYELQMDVPVLVTNTIMRDLPSKTRLAQEILEFGLPLQPHRPLIAPVGPEITRKIAR